MVNPMQMDPVQRRNVFIIGYSSGLERKETHAMPELPGQAEHDIECLEHKKVQEFEFEGQAATSCIQNSL